MRKTSSLILALLVLQLLLSIHASEIFSSPFSQHYASARYPFFKKISPAFPTLSFSISHIIPACFTPSKADIFALSSDLKIYSLSAPAPSPPNYKSKELPPAPIITRIDSLFSNLEIESGSKLACFSSKLLIIAGPSGYWTCSSSSCNFFSVALGNVTDIVFAKSQQQQHSSMIIGGTSGLFVFESFQAASSVETSKPLFKKLSNEPVTTLAYKEQTNTLYYTTAEKLFYVTNSKLERFEYCQMFQGSPFAMVLSSDNNLWLGNQLTVFVQDLSSFEFTRIGRITDDNFIYGTGIPAANITTGVAAPLLPNLLGSSSSSSSGSGGDVWFGTSTLGAWRYNSKRKMFHFYNGMRYLVGSSVVSMTTQINSASVYSVWIATSEGLSRITVDSTFTLDTKAELFEKQVYPTFNRLGLIPPHGGLSMTGDYRNVSLYNMDNDGLWTSMYLASQCFRYAVTKSEEAKENAWKAFEAMEKLNKVTNTPGFPARSYDWKDEPSTHKWPWHDSVTFPELRWKGDTSSDEITGHLFVYPLMHDLVAETPQEKLRVAALIHNITAYIIDNDFYLIDPTTGKPTLWGKWNPAYINNNPEAYDDRGINSLEMLAWLVSAYRITKNKKFSAAFEFLNNEENQYVRNVLNQFNLAPGDMNHSDDELSFLSYYTYFFAMQQEPLLKQQFGFSTFFRSIDLSWRYLQREKPSLFAAIYGAAKLLTSSKFLDDASVSNAIQFCLETWVLDPVSWSYNNTLRLDIIRNPEPDRRGQNTNSVFVTPYDEIDFFMWNKNPYEEARVNNGNIIYQNAHYLLPYWMARYHKLI